MHFVTKEQIDHFYMKFKGRDIVDMNEMLEVFEEIFDHPAPANTLSEARKKIITHALFTNPEVIKDLSEAAEDTELIFNEEEIMQMVHEVQNDRSFVESSRTPITFSPLIHIVSRMVLPIFLVIHSTDTYGH